MRYIRLVVSAGMLLAISGVAWAQQDFVNTFAGGGPNNVLATSADARTPMRVAVDNAGNFYYTTFEEGQNRVFKVDRSTRLRNLHFHHSVHFNGRRNFIFRNDEHLR